MEQTMAETSAVAEVGLATARKKMKVLVPVDESDGSFYALRWALDHLFISNEPQDEQEPNTITLVNVQPVFQPFIYPAGPVVYATPAVIDSVKKAQEQNAANILARALSICKDKKVKAETLILEGDPKDRICQAAEQLQVDLVVVGSRGLGTIKRALLGSVSNYCAHHAHCPVLIVKPPPKLPHE
ncbi:universal stress protein A-like protein [Sesamum indicum]|uniref:Universal stress protein A-like protein n=1 Tax=Sesamum indicum TaxID=4182 RepID=A0A6I9U8X3_SESIN|nr:universal stress protein A-like protein [Sesamum indicum]